MLINITCKMQHCRIYSMESTSNMSSVDQPGLRDIATYTDTDIMPVDQSEVIKYIIELCLITDPEIRKYHNYISNISDNILFSVQLFDTIIDFLLETKVNNLQRTTSDKFIYHAWNTLLNVFVYKDIFSQNESKVEQILYIMRKNLLPSIEIHHLQEKTNTNKCLPQILFKFSTIFKRSVDYEYKLIIVQLIISRLETSIEEWRSKEWKKISNKKKLNDPLTKTLNDTPYESQDMPIIYYLLESLLDLSLKEDTVPQDKEYILRFIINTLLNNGELLIEEEIRPKSCLDKIFDKIFYIVFKKIINFLQELGFVELTKTLEEAPYELQHMPLYDLLESLLDLSPDKDTLPLNKRYTFSFIINTLLNYTILDNRKEKDSIHQQNCIYEILDCRNASWDIYI